MVKKVNNDNYRGVNGMSLKKTNMTKMLLLYRYISLILTSVFFIVGSEGHQLSNILVVILGTSLSAFTMTYLYNQSRNNKKQMRIVIFIETVGNCIILLCSGGLHSPYMWYILNTVIMVGIECRSYAMWMNVGTYILCMLGHLYHISLKHVKLLDIAAEDLNLIAGFAISAFMIQLVIEYLRALEEKNNQIHDCLDYTLKLYETVYLFTSQEDKQKLIDVILNHMRTVRKLPSAIYLDFSKDYTDMRPYSYGVEQEDIDKVIKQVEITRLNKLCMQEQYEVVRYKGGYIGIPIRYTYYNFGMLLVKGERNLEELKFIAHVSGMMLKKITLEELNQQLVIGSEQNRIANEIHDSIIQQLFGVSCQLYHLEKGVDVIDDEKMAEALKELRGNVTESMAELRATIYGMSWNKQGKNNLIQKLEGFIKTMEQLHHPLTIELNIEDNLNGLSVEEQKALYRVCCEGVANGIKHGGATHMSINFTHDQDQLMLSIEDNGGGFDYRKVITDRKFGLGIKNMKQLVEQMHGDIDIDARPGVGTTIYVWLTYGKGREAV